MHFAAIFALPLFELAMGTSFADVRAAFDAMKLRPGYDAYAAGLAHASAYPAKKFAACARPARAIEVLVVLDQNGRVRQVVADTGGAASTCYIDALAAAHFDPPPFAPFVVSIVFPKRSR